MILLNSFETVNTDEQTHFLHTGEAVANKDSDYHQVLISSHLKGRLKTWVKALECFKLGLKVLDITLFSLQTSYVLRQDNLSCPPLEIKIKRGGKKRYNRTMTKQEVRPRRKRGNE